MIVVLYICRPQNPKELYNSCHSSLRNCIERCFGVIKRRNRIIATAPEYSIQTQARLIHAVCTLHNFVLSHDPTDATVRDVAELLRQSPQGRGNNIVTGTDGRNGGDAENLRDRIANDMWAQYQAYIANSTVD